MTADMSGKFNYNSLRQELKDNGVKNFDLAVALRQIASDNNIDNIRNLTTNQEIKIAQSIFENAQNQGVTPLFSNSATKGANDEILLPFGDNTEQLADVKIMGDGEDVLKMPEVYSDDDYDVVDYDEFYGFSNEEAKNSNAATENINKDEKELDFDGFKDNWAKEILKGVSGDKNTQNEVLKQIFNAIDTDKSETLSKEEISGAFYSALYNQQKDFKDVNTIPQEGYDPFEGAMETDMQNDSFNPQG